MILCINLKVSYSRATEMNIFSVYHDQKGRIFYYKIVADQKKKNVLNMTNK